MSEARYWTGLLGALLLSDRIPPNEIRIVGRDGTILGRIVDLDGIAPSPQADGDPRDPRQS